MTNISDDIRSVSAALGVLVGRVGTEDWSLLTLARANLVALAEQVEGLEQGLIPPPLSSPDSSVPLGHAGLPCPHILSGGSCGRVQ
ncbi:MAG: hypothetical protein RRY29_03535 [Desulfovibrionaceae bacterium]